MKSNYKIKVNIEIVESTEETQAEPHQQGPGEFEWVISEEQGCNIDECEKALLQTNYPALRDAIAAHLTTVSKKKASEIDTEYDCYVNEIPYRVDGEIGRFTFNTHRLESDEGQIIFDTSKNVFPVLKGKEWYRTKGFKEIAIVYGTARQSYRETRSLDTVFVINQTQPRYAPYVTIPNLKVNNYTII